MCTVRTDDGDSTIIAQYLIFHDALIFEYKGNSNEFFMVHEFSDPMKIHKLEHHEKNALFNSWGFQHHSW